MTTLTLELPEDIYRTAQELAKKQQRPIEQVIIDHLNLPQPLEIDILPEVAVMGLPELVEAVRATPSTADLSRTQELLDKQRESTLSDTEKLELGQLVSSEELRVLKRSQALHLLNASNQTLPEDIQTLLTKLDHQ